MNKSWRKEDGLDKKGFTLIELIVTIGLLAILLSLVVLKIDPDRYYLEKISKEIYYDIKDVKVKSMTSDGVSYSISLYNNYYILKKGTNTGTVQYKKVELKEDFEFLYEDQLLTFNYRGSPSQAQTITIRDIKRNLIKQITIVPVTGRILLIE
jgi:prepilin-type N-terminal cleavage/methylation domain-containing protein